MAFFVLAEFTPNLAVALKGKTRLPERFRPFYKLIGITGALLAIKPFLRFVEFHVQELETV
jgi:hypothetical protein